MKEKMMNKQTIRIAREGETRAAQTYQLLTAKGDPQDAREAFGKLREARSWRRRVEAWT